MNARPVVRRSALVVALVALLLAGVCVRLGVWQLSRWNGKRALERARRAALAAPPLTPDDPLRLRAAEARGRVVEVRGVWDTARVVLLTGRSHDGEPGVEIARPLRLGDGAVMVMRGWLPAEDGVHPAAADLCDTGRVTVRGVAEPMRRGAGDVAPEPLPGMRGAFTARWLDADSLAARLPGPFADWSLRELPAPGAPRLPLRGMPEPIESWIHINYAIQWFVFATAALAAALWVLLRGPGRDRAGSRH